MNRIRVAAHVHSDWSYDGHWPLERITSTFRLLGYDAVLLAEHDRGFDTARWDAHRAACATASTDRTLLVPGLEYSDASNSVHVPVWGDIPFLGEGVDTGELLERAHEVGGLAVLAHIGRRDAYKQISPEWLSRLIGLELWNRKYDGYAPNKIAADILRKHSKLVPFVSLDLHRSRQLHPLTMVLELDGPTSEETICDALRARRAYPRALGVPALKLTSRAASPAMQGLERTRRSVARSARGVRAKARDVR